MKITRRQLRNIILELVAQDAHSDDGIYELEDSEEVMSEMEVEDDARSAEGGASFAESPCLSNDQIRMIINEELYLALEQRGGGDMYGGPSGIAVPYGDDLDEDDLDEISDSEQDAKITDLQLKLQSDTAAANKGGGNLARARMRGDQAALAKTQFA